ncbi:DUF3310 domain-containing protein [Streptomyces sp. NPDC052101]|uniref:DUF3310 domain-containing protein n=1 Tax=Streptomyces sp. NPDC052101 TaxID=3155763 RepID=UPI00343D6549
MARFKVDDEVVVVGASGHVASWLYEDKRGVIQAVHEGQPYPNDVKLHAGGALCFTDDELMLAVESNPGRRLLSETKGLSLGVDPYKAQKVMKAAFKPVNEFDSRSELVNSPSHYTTGQYEVIETIEDSLSEEAFRGYLLGNMTKYLLRCQHKHADGGVQDLKKLIWYASKFIEKQGER